MLDAVAGSDVGARPSGSKRRSPWRNVVGRRSGANSLKPIVIEVQGLVAAPIETVYDVFRPIDLTTIMLGYGPLPPVAGVEDQTGDWDGVGESRIIRLADGHGMLETLTAVDPPHGFSYTLSDLTNVLRFLVHHAEPAPADRDCPGHSRRSPEEQQDERRGGDPGDHEQEGEGDLDALRQRPAPDGVGADLDHAGAGGHDRGM